MPGVELYELFVRTGFGANDRRMMDGLHHAHNLE
jgi:hypothetical protein